MATTNKRFADKTGTFDSKIAKKQPVSTKESLQKQIGNYQTRLKSSGINPEEATDKRNFIEKFLNLPEDQNVLFDIFEIINRPQNALLTGINNILNNESFGEGLLEGITGEKKTTGKDILLEHTDLQDETGKLNLVDALGFGIDLVSDPLDWALIPLTGGASKAADISVDTAKTAGKAYKYSKLDDLLGLSKKGIHLATGHELIGKGIGKAVKGTGKLANNVIEGTLGTLDKAELNKVTKAAEKAGFGDDITSFLKSLGLDESSMFNRKEGFRALKSSIKNTFNEGATKLGKLKKSIKNAMGSNKFAERVYKEYENNLMEDAYKYVRSNADLTDSALKTSLNNLDDFIAKGGKNNTYAEWIKRNPTDELAKILTKESNKVAEDLLNIWQYGKDTTISGGKALQGLFEGNLSGDQKSMKALKDLIDKYSEKSGYRVGLTDNLKELLGEGVSDLSNKNVQLNLLDDASKDALRKIANNSDFQEELANLGLKYNLEYTPDELKYLENLKGNKKFMDFFESSKGAYNEVADLIKATTGFDYSDIVNREGYLRKAQGTVADLDSRINKIQKALADTNIDDKTKKVLQDQLENLEMQRATQFGGSPVTKRFGSQEYRQPAMVANRQYREGLEAQKSAITKQIDNLKGTLSRNKTDDLIIKESKILDNVGVTKLEGGKEKIQQRIKSLQQKQFNINKELTDITDKINENFIDKAINIQDKSVSKSITNTLTKIDNLKNKIAKETDPTKITKIQDQMQEEVKKLAANYAKVDGAIDDTIAKALNKNAKSIDKYKNKIDKLNRVSEQLQVQNEKLNLINTKINDLKGTLGDKINRLEFDLSNINPTKDETILNQIKSLEKTISILDEEAGQTLFSENFFAGLDDFVNNAAMTNKTASLFKEAIQTGAFLDEEIMSLKPAKGKTAVDGSKLAKKLNSIQTIINDGKIDEGTRALIKQLEGKTFYMDDRAKALFGVLDKSINGKETKGLLNLFDRMNNTFKKFSTLTPGFHIRNAIGNTTNMYLSGMSPTDIAKYQVKATQLMNNSDNLLKKVMDKGVDALTENEKASWDILTQFYKGGFGEAGTAVRDLEKLQQKVKLGGATNKVAGASVKLNNKLDNMNRLATLMFANDNPKYVAKLGAANPIQAVGYALMDPSNLSDTERNVIKKIIPFYTFTKQNLMFQATNLTKNTARYSRLYKGLRDAYNDLDENGYYEYQKDAMQIPLPWKDSDGNQLFLKSNLPVSDLGEFLSSPIQRTVASMTPVIKAPVELTTGKSLFTGDDTNYKTLTRVLDKMGVRSQGLYNTAQAAETILNNFGLQNVSTNLIKKIQAILDNANGEETGQQLWAEIMRSMLQSTNQESVETNKLFDELEGYQNIVKRLKNQGVDIPTMTQLNQVNKMKLNRFKNKRANLK